MEVKQVIVIRRDLKMRRGKEIAQGAHSAMMFFVTRLRKYQIFNSNIFLLPFRFLKFFLSFSEAERKWIKASFSKITLQVDTEEELLEIKKECDTAGIVCHVVCDNGQTEFHGVPTNTCLCIRPDYSTRIDPITGKLKLY